MLRSHPHHHPQGELSIQSCLHCVSSIRHGATSLVLLYACPIIPHTPRRNDFSKRVQVGFLKSLFSYKKNREDKLKENMPMKKEK